MAFDDVSMPAVVFVCVTTVLALVGNTLVLLVFGCRWRSTNDTKIYIMTLAVLDLLCVMVSSPRDLLTLLPEGRCYLNRAAMHVYCRLSVFFTHHLNVASALILVAIAASRFVKVTRKNTDVSLKGKQGPQGICCPWPGVRTTLRRLLRGVSTVRGAKVACAMALGVAVVQVCPALVIYGSGNHHHHQNHVSDTPSFPATAVTAATATITTITSTASNLTSIPTNSTFSSTDTTSFTIPTTDTTIPTTDTSTTSNANITIGTGTTAISVVDITTTTTADGCHASCSDDVHPRYQGLRKVFDITQFVFFALLTVFMVAIYVAILGKLCCQQRHDSAERGGSDAATKRWDESSSFFSLDEASTSVLYYHKQDGVGKEGETESARCVITTVENSAASSSVEEGATGTSSAPVSPTSTSGLCAEESSALTRAGGRGGGEKGGERGGGGGENDTVQTRSNNNKQLNFSLCSEQWSQAVLNRQSSQGAVNSNRLSTASFQLTKTGNRARLTTLVFLMVTFIYIVSYFPYFVILLHEYIEGAHAEQRAWSGWSLTSVAIMKICRRSYLIANAANPLVYGLCNPYFREQLGKLIICRRDVI